VKREYVYVKDLVLVGEEESSVY